MITDRYENYAPLLHIVAARGRFVMETKYDILLADQVIGTAIVKKEGLYYNFFCKCRLSGEVICKLVAYCGDKRQSLGVCVPMNGEFGLVKRLPVKRLGEGELVIRAEPNRPKSADVFVPIRADEPFAYIDRLEKSYLVYRNNRCGVMVTEEDQSSTVI